MIRSLYIALCCTVLALAVSTAAMSADICYPPKSLSNKEKSDVLAWLDRDVNYSSSINSAITDVSKSSESAQEAQDKSAALICPAPHADIHTNTSIATN